VSTSLIPAYLARSPNTDKFAYVPVFMFLLTLRLQQQL
ncbi:unnamed protein product, partial [marine sediment metagenome]